MSYIKRSPRRELDPSHDELVKSLVDEIAAGPTGTGPRIIEEAVHGSDRLHVYVDWDDWKNVKEEHRSAAILDAYRQAPGLGDDAVRRVTIAMGLTSEESKALGIDT